MEYHIKCKETLVIKLSLLNLKSVVFKVKSHMGVFIILEKYCRQIQNNYDIFSPKSQLIFLRVF